MNMKTPVFTLFVFVTLFLAGCDSRSKIVYNTTKIGVSLGYSCAEEGKTEKECIGELDAAILNKIL